MTLSGFSDFLSRVGAKRSLTKLVHILLSLAILGIVWCRFGATQASALNIKWDGGGSTNNWSECANWDNTNTCPGVSDNVTFDSTSTKAATIDASFTGSIATLTIASTYSGTITQARSLTTSGGFSQAAGTFLGDGDTISIGTSFGITGGTFTASSGAISIATNFALTTGTFTAPSTTFTVPGSFTINSGTFIHNNGTVIFSGNTNNINCNNNSSSNQFNLVSFAGQTNTKTIGNSSACTIPIGASPTIPNGITLTNGNLNGSGTLTQTTGTLTIGASGSVTGFTGLTGTTNSLSVGASFNMGSYSPAFIGGTFTLSAGTFTAPSGTLTVVSTFNITGGTYTHNNGTLNFSGAAANISCNGTGTSFNTVTFTGQTGVKTIGFSTPCSFTIGANPTFANGITLNNSTLTGSGTLTVSAGAVNFNNDFHLVGFTGFVVVNNYTQSATTASAAFDMSNYTTVTFSTGFVLNTPTNPFTNTFTAPTGLMTVAATLTISTGTTFSQPTGTLKLTNNGSGAITCNGTYTFSLVQMSPLGSTKTINAGCNLPVGDSPTFGTNTLYVFNGTISGTGTLTIPGVGTTISTGAVFSGFSAINFNSTTTTLPGTTDFSSMPSLTSVSFGGATSINNASSVITLPSTSSFTGAITFSAGSLTASSSTTTIKSGLTISGTTSFNSNGGVISLAGGIASIACNNLSLGTVNFTGQTGAKTIGSDCNLNLGANPTLVGAVTLNGTLSGSGTLTIGSASTLTLSGSSSIASFSALNVLGGFSVAGANIDLSTLSSVSGSGAYTLSSGTLTMPANGADLASLTISGGTFNAASGSMTIDGALTITGTPTFNHSNGTIVFGGNTSVLACGGMTFYNIVISSSGTKTISSDCTFPLGANPYVTRIALYGTLSGSGVLHLTSQIPNVFYPGYQILGFSNIEMASGSTTLPLVTKLLTSNQGTYYQTNSGATAMTYVGAWTMASKGDKLFLGWSRSVPEYNNDFTFLSYYQNGSFAKIMDLPEQDVARMKVFGNTLYIPGTDPNTHDWDAGDLITVDTETLANNIMTYRYSSDHYVDATTTDANGHYFFTGLRRIPYRIKFVRPANYRFTTQAVSSGNFNAIDSKPVTSTGIYAQCTSTDDVGFRFDGPSWTDSTVDAGLVANSSSADTANNSTLDSSYYGGDMNIGDLVWNDANANGKQDEGESGVAGVRVELYTRDPYFPCGIHSQALHKDDDGTIYIDYAYVRVADAPQLFGTSYNAYFGTLADMVMKSTDNGNTWQIVDDSFHDNRNYFSSDLTKYQGVFYRNPTLQGGYDSNAPGTITIIDTDTFSYDNYFPYWIGYSLDGNNWQSYTKYTDDLAQKTRFDGLFVHINYSWYRNPGYQYSGFVGFLDGVLIPGTAHNQILKFKKDTMETIETQISVFGDLIPNYTNSLQNTNISEDITGAGQRYNSMVAAGNYLYEIGSDNKLYISTDIRGWNQVADFSQVDSGAQMISLYYWPEKDWIVVATAGTNGSIYYLDHSDVVSSVVNFPANNPNFTFQNGNVLDQNIFEVGGTGHMPVRVGKNGTRLADFSAGMAHGCNNFSDFVGDTDVGSSKSFIKGVTKNECNGPVDKLYIPIGKTSDAESVLLCPNVNSLADIHSGCANSLILADNQARDYAGGRVSVSKEKIGDFWYWVIAGGNDMGGMTYQANVCTDTTPGPKVPVITSIKQLSPTSVQLFFSPAAGDVSNYSLAYGTNPNNLEFLVLDIGGSWTTNFTVNSLKPNTKYYYAVRAINGCVGGKWSKLASYPVTLSYGTPATLTVAGGSDSISGQVDLATDVNQAPRSTSSEPDVSQSAKVKPIVKKLSWWQRFQLWLKGIWLWLTQLWGNFLRLFHR